MTNGGIIEGGSTLRVGSSDPSPATLFFHVPVLDEVFAKSRLGNPDEQVSVEKHKKHNRPMGHLKPSEGRDLVAWKSFCQSVPNTPMKVGEQWETIGWAAKLPNGSMRVFHGAGTTDEEIAGQRYAEKEARLRPQHITFGSGDCSFAQCKRRLQRLGG